MTKREVVLEALEFRPPPYVPWAWDMTQQCAERMRRHLGTDDLSGFLDTHFLTLGSAIGRFEDLGGGRFRDVYGVVWDRSIDPDIGTPVDWPIRRPEDLARYDWPDADADVWYDGIERRIAAHPGLFRVFMVGFSLYERAWTMRGMADLLMDMIARPEFVERLLDAIVEHDLQQVRRALTFDIDAVYFGDDYGMQTGLIMGIEHWRHFLKPRLARLFAPVREAGKYVCMHSCGRVTELFDELVEIGLNSFNPFQPEVMDVFAVMRQYHGRLAFHGGMSIQKTLPFGTEDEVRAAAAALIDAGRNGGYIFSPSHSVPRDVPPANLVAMMDVVRAQPGAPQFPV
ncbi:MAG TPA: uroporphyrinogen decarboxylase family protein [Phycisphaerae bacterium]|nr:uroporphyrinogen decarboxylase family protein [Phycisphaerae bacterium]